MLVFLALGDAKLLSFALGDAKVPDARYFAFWWNIGLTILRHGCFHEIEKEHGQFLAVKTLNMGSFKM